MQSFRVTPMPGSTTARLTAEAKVGPENQKPGAHTGVGPLSGLPVIIEETFTESFRKVGYPGLPETYFFSPATYRARAVDIHVAPNLPRRLQLPGTGDEVQSLLENIGIHATNLTVDDIAAGKLADFDTLAVIGTRAYTAHADLIVANNHILDFAKNGGTVVVQYQAPRLPPHRSALPHHAWAVTATVSSKKVAKVELSPSTTGVLDLPQQDHLRRLRQLDRRTRPVRLPCFMGHALRRSHRNPRRRPGTTARRHLGRTLRQGLLRLHCIRALPPTPRSRPRSIPPVRKSPVSLGHGNQQRNNNPQNKTASRERPFHLHTFF